MIENKEGPGEDIADNLPNPEPVNTDPNSQNTLEQKEMNTTSEDLSTSSAGNMENSSISEKIVGEAALLFDPLNKKSISDLMQLVLFNPEIKNNLVKKGRRRIKDFSWEKCSLNTLKTYKSILN